MSSSESAAQIEQFLILAKGQKAKALETIIEQILSHPSIYVFGEFLSQPNFQEIGSDNKHFKTLELFAYDNFVKFKGNKEDYIDLKPNQIKKLKMISIADMAQRNKILHYQDLMRQLDIQNLRELEDLIIDCMYNELLSGKLDQFNQQFHVVHTYGRDVRESDIDSMLGKLADWDKQLEKSQVFIEKNVQECNTSIMNTYERQLKLELELRERRDHMLKEISEGKDQEFGGSGPGLNFGKKKSSRRDDDQHHMGGGGFMSGLRQEMKKANYHQHQPKQQLLSDDYQGDDLAHSSAGNTNFYPRQDPSSNLTLEDEDEEELDINQISNKDLEEKIRKMREQIRRKQEGIEGSPGEDDDLEEEEEPLNDESQVDDGNEDEQQEEQEEQYYEEENHQEDQSQQDEEEQDDNQDSDGQSFGHEDEDLTESQLKKIDLRSKIDQMKQALAQYQNQGSIKSDHDLSKNGQRSLDYNDEEQTSTQNIRNYQSSSSKSNDMTGISSSKHANKSKLQQHNFQQASRTNKNAMRKEDLEVESFENDIKKNVKSQKSIVNYNPKSNKSQIKGNTKKGAKEESDEEQQSSEESDEDDEEHDSDDEDNDIPLESEIDDGMSRYTIKSRKSQRRGKNKNRDKSPQANISINPQFDMNGFPMNQLGSPQMFGMNGEPFMQSPMGMNPLFMPPGVPPNLMPNPMLGINPQMFPIPPGMTNPADIALFQQQQMLQHQQAQQTFGPNALPNFMLQGQQPPLLAQQTMMLNQQQQLQQQQLQQQLTQSQQQQQQQQQDLQQLQQQLHQSNQEIQHLSSRLMDQDKEVQQLQMLLHDQKIQYEQEIKMMSRETQYKYDDYQRLMHDNQFLIDKAETAQQKYQAMKREFENQKEFYEKALEQRFSQMEEFEEECMQLRQKVQELQDRENDNQIKCDIAIKDKEELKRKLEMKDKENFNGTRKEEDLQAKIEELQKQLKDKESVTDKKVEESFNLKQKIDAQRQEIDKLKKKVENLEDQVTHKDLQLKQVNDDFINFQKKQKYDQTTLKNQAQGVNDDLKNELMVERQSNQALRAQLEHQADQIYDMEEQLQQSEEIRRERDQLRRENQQLQGQLKNQRFDHENMTINNNGSRSNKNVRQPRDDFQQSADSWMNQEPPIRSNRPKQNNLLSQQENPTKPSNKYNLPPSFFKDNDYTEDQILNQVYQKKPLVNDRSNNIPPKGQPARYGSSSNIPPGIQTKQDKEKEQKIEQVRNIEQNLLGLQLEQKRLQAEFDKIPDNAKTIAQRRRKEELDTEIKIVNKNISGLKNKLRELDALHR